MSASILVVDDEPDVADLFRQSYTPGNVCDAFRRFAGPGCRARENGARWVEPARKL